MIRDHHSPAALKQKLWNRTNNVTFARYDGMMISSYHHITRAVLNVPGTFSTRHIKQNPLQ